MSTMTNLLLLIGPERQNLMIKEAARIDTQKERIHWKPNVTI